MTRRNSPIKGESSTTLFSFIVRHFFTPHKENIMNKNKDFHEIVDAIYRHRLMLSEKELDAKIDKAPNRRFGNA